MVEAEAIVSITTLHHDTIITVVITVGIVGGPMEATVIIGNGSILVPAKRAGHSVNSTIRKGYA